MTTYKRWRPFANLLLTFLFLSQVACDSGDNQTNGTSSGNPKPGEALIITSNYPLYFVTSRIVQGVENGPDIVLPEIDGDPVSWVPESDQIQRLQLAERIVVNGAGAEPWLDWISLMPDSVLDTTAVLSDQLITQNDSVIHRHGPKGDHSHGESAFTTWLDPILLTRQAREIERMLSALDTRNAIRYRQNLAALEQDLSLLDQTLSALFATLNGEPVLFSHPVYQYLQTRYNINGRSVHWEPDEEPTTGAWVDMQKKRGGHPARIMIWEDDPLPSNRQRLLDAGINSVVYHTAANRPAEGDFLSVMQNNIQRIERVLGNTRR